MTDANVATDPEKEHQSRSTSHEDEELEDDASHLDEVPDGSGCTEIWEHLSDRRENDGEE